MRTVWWIKCVLLLSLAHQGVTLGLVWISYVSQFLPLTIYNCCGCSEHQVSSLYYTPSKQNLLNGCSGILCGTTTCHEDWTSDMSARFSITWEYFVGRGTHVFFLEKWSGSVSHFTRKQIVQTIYTLYCQFQPIFKNDRQLNSLQSSF